MIKSLIETSTNKLKADNVRKIIDKLFNDESFAEFSNQFEFSIVNKDLVRFVKRLFAKDDTLSAENVFEEFIRTFLFRAPTIEKFDAFVEYFGSRLNLSRELAQKICFEPINISINERGILIGRSFYMQALNSQTKTPTSNFSWTKIAREIILQTGLALQNNENLLLVSESGFGKTTMIQYLASVLNHELVILNLSSEVDINSLFGYFKILSNEQWLESIKNDFVEIFKQSFDEQKNSEFLDKLERLHFNKKYSVLLKIMTQFATRESKKAAGSDVVNNWLRFQKLLMSFDPTGSILRFKYHDGILIDAIQSGKWLLIDEINLLPRESYAQLVPILDKSLDFINPIENLSSSSNCIKKHPDFRVIGCMNPGNSVGKSNLPEFFRSLFTETNIACFGEIGFNDYCEIIQSYNSGYMTETIAQIFIDLKGIEKELVTFNQEFPEFSVRNLCRALRYFSKLKVDRVNLHQALDLLLTSNLSEKSRLDVEQIFCKHGFDLKKFANSKLDYRNSTEETQTVRVENVQIEIGSETIQNCTNKFIITPTLKNRLRTLAKIVQSGYPGLLQGETSVGKTSMIIYLAQLTGNKCIRLNNHEGIDISDYIGSYQPQQNGEFKYVYGNYFTCLIIKFSHNFFY